MAVQVKHSRVSELRAQKQLRGLALCGELQLEWSQHHPAMGECGVKAAQAVQGEAEFGRGKGIEKKKKKKGATPLPHII